MIRQCAFGLLMLLSACGKKGDAPHEEDTPSTPEVAASTDKASVESFTRVIGGIGTVIAPPDHYAALSAPSPTRIAKVHVAEGQRVAAGAPLVEFDQIGFNAAAAGSEATLLAAQRNYERAQRLVAEGISPRRDAEQALAELGRARADAATNQRAQQLSVLRSPITGVITRLAAVLGAPADAGQVLVEIADPSAFGVVLSLGPVEASSVLPGARVRLSTGEKSGGDHLGEGRVASVAATVDSTSRSVAVRVDVTSPTRRLRLGESVFGEIAIATRPAVVVPIEALLPAEEVGKYKVFVVDAKGIATAREVEVGGRTETKAEIVEGLKGGETVVTQGAFAMQDSAKVTKPVPVKP